MPKKAHNKTQESKASVADYLNAVEPASARKDAKLLAKIFKQTTGAKPKMWGSSIVGYGKYQYTLANGKQGESAATAFSIRKSGPVLYIMPGYKDYAQLLKDLGPHKLGKACLYLKNLEGVEVDVLRQLIEIGIKDLAKKHAVSF